jgi:hypothetical protein
MAVVLGEEILKAQVERVHSRDDRGAMSELTKRRNYMYLRISGQAATDSSSVAFTHREILAAKAA